MEERITCTHDQDRVCVPPCFASTNRFDTRGEGALVAVQKICGLVPNRTSFDPKSPPPEDLKRLCSNNCCVSFNLALGACNYDGAHWASWTQTRDYLARMHAKCPAVAHHCASMADVLQRLEYSEAIKKLQEGKEVTLPTSVSNRPQGASGGKGSGKSGGLQVPRQIKVRTGPTKMKQALKNPLILGLVIALSVGACMCTLALCYYRSRVKRTLLYASPNAPKEMPEVSQG